MIGSPPCAVLRDATYIEVRTNKEPSISIIHFEIKRALDITIISSSRISADYPISVLLEAVQASAGLCAYIIQ